MRTLVVASDARFIMHVATALEGEAEDVVFVATPERALALLDDGARFDVIVADADTHPSGGFFLGRDLDHRRSAGQPDVPPLVLCISRDQDKFLARWSGAEVIVLKPLDAFDLALACRKVAAGDRVPALPHITAAERISTKGIEPPPAQESAGPLSGGP